MLQSGSEQFRFGDMTEEHADVVKPARFGIGQRRREKSLRLVVEMLDEKHAPDSGELPACAKRFNNSALRLDHQRRGFIGDSRTYLLAFRSWPDPIH